MNHTVYCLAVPDPVGVIGVGDGGANLAGGRQLPDGRPQEAAIGYAGGG